MLISSLRTEKKTYDSVDKMETIWGSQAKAQTDMCEAKWNCSSKKVSIYVNLAIKKNSGNVMYILKKEWFFFFFFSFWSEKSEKLF